MAVPAYATPFEKAWYYIFRIICGLIFCFLIGPLFVIIPLSFNAEPYFSFTQKMLTLDPEGYSLRWYQDFFTSEAWLHSIKNSILIAIASTILATILGTIAALAYPAALCPIDR
ncbi:ABC transporter permease [Nitrincola sp. A-D6]|uniref:ABC transporter permease n=1 Tax=Nitrincola sp. A-D6 TaxID=1545442 RepID=UPI002E160CB7